MRFAVYLLMITNFFNAPNHKRLQKLSLCLLSYPIIYKSDVCCLLLVHLNLSNGRLMLITSVFCTINHALSYLATTNNPKFYCYLVSKLLIKLKSNKWYKSNSLVLSKLEILHVLLIAVLKLLSAISTLNANFRLYLH